MSQLATSVLSCFQAPFMLEGHEVYISASLGLCSYPQDGLDVETLLKNSDLAMYSAKNKVETLHVSLQMSYGRK